MLLGDSSTVEPSLSLSAFFRGVLLEIFFAIGTVAALIIPAFCFFKLKCQDRPTTNKIDAATAIHRICERWVAGAVVFLFMLFHNLPDISGDKASVG